jgi:integrase/recombinase XerD
MRHTTATNMLRGGAPLTHVQRYLGHESPSTTQIYAELCQDEVQMSHEKSLAG